MLRTLSVLTCIRNRIFIRRSTGINMPKTRATTKMADSTVPQGKKIKTDSDVIPDKLAQEKSKKNNKKATSNAKNNVKPEVEKIVETKRKRTKNTEKVSEIASLEPPKKIVRKKKEQIAEKDTSPEPTKKVVKKNKEPVDEDEISPEPTRKVVKKNKEPVDEDEISPEPTRKVVKKNKEPVDEDEISPEPTRKVVKKNKEPIDEETVSPEPTKKGGEKNKEPIGENKVKSGRGRTVKPKPENKREKAEKPQTSQKAPKKETLNKTATDWESIKFNSTTKNAKNQLHSLKITSWNVDGLRAWLKKDGLSIIKHDKPDIFCVQETKCSTEKLPDDLKNINGYHSYWCSSEKEGYAGVGVYSKIMPIDVSYGIGDEKQDEDGRCLTLEYENFFLVNVYVPNAGRGLVTLPKRLDWNSSFQSYIKELDKKKPVIVCGDMNVAHNEIDLTNPKSNKKNAGFTPEEREGMTQFLEEGFKDTFRQLYPNKKDTYTFWSYMSNARAKNVGWRLDYFIVSDRIMDNVCDNAVRDQVFGSDHCPITLFINI
ncbi:hypothetical protein ABEB36_003328 [Hypothenemus hampei]|uniref:DNA-(apurinic or apyrimidinic site) endonuclease n=1 Tax=Hypothenemus hampei TaxID=57062 RepID=A0ABD1FBX5_HYPHA